MKKSKAKAKNAPKAVAKGKAKKPVKKAGATKKALTKNSGDDLVTRIKLGVETISEQIENVFASKPDDIVDALKQDHQALRNFLSLLKDTEKEMAERRRAYAAFSSLLKSHSSSEEKAVYATAMSLPGKDMHIKVAEGFVEHHVADDLMKRMERTKDAQEWSAHANVLAESVEHHLKEEERDLLPKLRKEASQEDKNAMLAKFVTLRQSSQKSIGQKNAGVLASAAAVD